LRPFNSDDFLARLRGQLDDFFGDNGFGLLSDSRRALPLLIAHLYRVKVLVL
jgi:hypothetical protein